jgi:hypothetical protein
METNDRDLIDESNKNFFKKQKDVLQNLFNRYKRENELLQSEAKYLIEISKLYSLTNFITELFVGNILRACISFLALYILLNQFNPVFEKLLNTIHFNEVFPNFDIRLLTLFISLSTIVSANISNSRRESLMKVEERLAIKATTDVTKKISDLQEDVY